MQNAFGQALTYATTIEPPPPFLIVTDIGYCFDLYASFDGTRNYRKFPDALSSRISLEALAREPQHNETLRAIFTDPHSLDPSKRLRRSRERSQVMSLRWRAISRRRGTIRRKSRNSSCAASSPCLRRNLGDTRPMYSPSGRTVTPEQFHGIEIKPWAKEITELVLWIGWLQWQIRTRGWKSHPDEPVLRDYHNIECRDAVLAYDAKEPLLDDQGKPVTRWDGETMKPHPVTAAMVPDESARVPVHRYLNPRKEQWPEAEFVVGNPPYIGKHRLRQTLGDDYVEALRLVYQGDPPDNADHVMYWWSRAAKLVMQGNIRGFGFVSTNSIALVNRERTEDVPEGIVPVELLLSTGVIQADLRVGADCLQGSSASRER